MPKQALILDEDSTFAAKLAQALSAQDKATQESFKVVVVSSVKEACLHLVQQPQDVAFIPLDGGAKILRALRALQPDLRLVLLAPDAGAPLPASFSGQVQGVLIKSLLAVDLPAVLAKVMGEPMVVATDVSQVKLLAERPARLLRSALVNVDLGEVVKTAVISHKTGLVAATGELNLQQAAAVAQHVSGGWSGQDVSTARLQFMQLPARPDDLLLYSCQITPQYLLSLVAGADAPLGRLRHRAQEMARVLAEFVNSSGTGQLPQLGKTGLLYNRTSYAIVWRPVAVLPKALRIPLRRAIERLAKENECMLTDVHVAADLIHVVAVCPPGRDSIWAAYLFKNGSEEIIQHEYGVAAQLWETGFYAIESMEPLSSAELNIFLENAL